MLKAKTIVGNLASIGDPINKRDLQLYLLRGLGSRYNNFIFNIKMRERFPSINVVHIAILKAMRRRYKNNQIHYK